MEQTNDQKTEDLGFHLNGKDYAYDTLNDEQKQIVHQLKDIQYQLSEIEFKHTQMSAAKQHFTDMLVNSIENPDKESKSEDTTKK